MDAPKVNGLAISLAHGPIWLSALWSEHKFFLNAAAFEFKLWSRQKSINMKAVRSDWLTNSFSLASGKEKTATAQCGKMQYYCQKVSNLFFCCGSQSYECGGRTNWGWKLKSLHCYVRYQIIFVKLLKSTSIKKATNQTPFLQVYPS